MGTDRPIVGNMTELIVGQRTFHYQTDMEALEMAEHLPECVRWQVKLQHGKGMIDSDKYRQDPIHETEREKLRTHKLLNLRNR